MAAKINLKTIDYYRFKKLIIDGNRDDYNSCSKEIKALCDHVQTFNFRDEQFDEETDRCRFDEICCFYRQILASKRINPLDMKIKSGWWGENKSNTYSVGKIKATALKELLLYKAKDWAQKHGYSEKEIAAIPKRMDGPGIYVFKHKERHCFQFVGRADKVFNRCAEKIKNSFEGTSHEPLSALFILSTASDWEFYFTPIMEKDDERVLRILENDIILRHDCIWPHGLNFVLRIDSLIEVSEFRKSCVRHSWPPEGETVDEYINLDKIRKEIEEMKEDGILNEQFAVVPKECSSSTSSRRSSITDADIGNSAFEPLDLPSSPSDVPDRPGSPHSVVSTATYTVESINKSSSELSAKNKTSRQITGKENMRSPRPGSASKTRSNPRPTSGSPKKQKKPEWKGVLDDEQNYEEEVNTSFSEEKPPAWTVEFSNSIVDRPSDLPIKNPKAPSSPKKIQSRIPSGTPKKRL